MTVYMDYNASSPLRPSARDAMVRHLDQIGNPASVHYYGRNARHLVEGSRGILAQILGVSMDDIIFTSGGTESNNLFLKTVQASGFPLVMGDIEHASLTDGAPIYEKIPFLPCGLIDLDGFDRVLDKVSGAPFFVSLHWAHNVTGILQPIADVGRRVHNAGGFFHVDASQSFGRIAMGSVAEMAIDYMTLSAHKIGGPCGVGAFVVRGGRPLFPLICGGGQEKFRRSGTPNTVGIVGFAAAASSAILDLNQGVMDVVSVLRDDLEAQLMASSPASIVFGRTSPRIPNTCYVTMPAVPSQTQVMALDLDGFSVSAGSACASGALKAPSFLTFFGHSDAVAGTALRISIGPATTQSNIDDFCRAWIRLHTSFQPDDLKKGSNS